MVWADPQSGLITGSLITSGFWNQDVRDNTRFLKGLDGVIDLENTVTPDLDDTHDLGTPALRWQEIFASQAIWNGGHRVAGRREERNSWEDDNIAEYQNDRTTFGAGGTISVGGTGQIVIKADNNAVGGGRVDQQLLQNSAADNKWTPTKRPYYRVEMHIDLEGGDLEIFLGLRATPGNSFPTSSEDHMGFKKFKAPDTWFASNSAGSAQTTTDVDTNITISNRHILELYQTSTKIDYWVDGVLRATHTTNLPDTDLVWEVIMESNGTGGATSSHLTVGQQILQEDTP